MSKSMKSLNSKLSKMLSSNKSSKLNENMVIVVLLIILVVLVVYYIRQNNENYDNRPTIYFFYVNWCPHCKTAKPIVDNFIKNNSNVNVKQINCEEKENKALAQDFNVKGYPTIVLEKDNKRTELETGVSELAISDLVKNN
jgi:thioredoxin 1